MCLMCDSRLINLWGETELSIYLAILRLDVGFRGQDRHCVRSLISHDGRFGITIGELGRKIQCTTGLEPFFIQF